MKTFLETEITQAYAQAPKVVTEYLENGDEFLAVVRSVGTEFGLHIDQTGLVSESIRNLLIGLVTPTDFAQMLSEYGFPRNQIDEIMVKVNKEIFMPLREEMRKAAEQERADDAPAASAPARPSVPVPRYAPPQNLSQAAPSPVRQVPAPPPPLAAARAAPSARPPITDPERELPAGEPMLAPAPPSVPAPRLSSAPLPPRAVLPGASQSAASPAHAMLRPQPRAPRAPMQNAPPANLPGVFAPKPLPAPAESPDAADPYREPLDEK